jgi:hypothetical protein
MQSFGNMEKAAKGFTTTMPHLKANAARPQAALLK